MAKLTANQESFVRLMSKNDEHALRGFQLLISRPEPEKIFDEIYAAGLFDPKTASGPAPADGPNSVRIPYWAPLDYLEHLARLSGEREDLLLADKVMNVVRGVSLFRDENGKARDNYHVYRKFAEIIGLIPKESFLRKDLKLIPIWLDSKFDRSLVGQALSGGIITQFLAGGSKDELEKACLILGYCTELVQTEETPSKRRNKDFKTVVDGYFLRGIIKKHAVALGSKSGKLAASLFLERIKEAFHDEENDLPSYLRRPAVEKHSQNHSWQEAENCLVEGLRDVLIAWVANDPESACEFIAAMLTDDNDMIRRVGIYLLNERWDKLKSLYQEVVGPELFDSKHIHVLYQLFRKRFKNFLETDKVATVEAIRQLPLPRIDEDPEGYLKYKQRNWLSAIAGQGLKDADEWFEKLNSEEGIGNISDHPDFHFYMEEASWGPGPSPYGLNELLSFAEDGSLIKKLNAFVPGDSWRGPSVKALVEVLEKAVENEPEIFVRILLDFINAKRSYQYGIINGFKSLWESGDYSKKSFDWGSAWTKLMELFKLLLHDPSFWKEAVYEEKDLSLTPTREWIPPVIAEFLKSGTKNDEKAYPVELLPDALELIKALLKNLEIEEKVVDDAMTQAINSSRGKTHEALFNHALRVCRIEDKKHGEHLTVWAEIEPVFNQEIELCMAGKNFDFSTLSGAYLVNLNYLSHDWLQSIIEKIFPVDLPGNFRCAITGLSYASATKPTYKLLVSSGVIDRALNFDFNVNQVRSRIIDRIALAYLWGDEELDSPRFSCLLTEDRISDLESMSNFFWSVRREKLSAGQVELILAFWKRCIEFGGSLSQVPENLYSSLSNLSCFLEKITEKFLALLMAVAPFVDVNHDAEKFIEELDRLLEDNSKEVCKILGVVLENYKPVYDYEDRLKSLLKKLLKKGFRSEVIDYLNKVRRLKGVEQLYKELT